MRVVSWTINGIRAGVRHGFVDFVDRSAADIVGVQQVRARPEDIPPAARRPQGWHTAFTVAERRGYSGVGLYSKLQPVRVDTSLGVPRFDREGRFMAAHFQTARGRFVVVNGYFPKGSGPARDNSRVGYKLDFSRTVFGRAQALRRRGPVDAQRVKPLHLRSLPAEGIVRLTLRPAQCRDEHSPAPLPSASLSARNHQPCRLALPQILHELPGC